ncbi:xanthine dehydrogenase family protein molybdopterin-binding subunit [Egicoccus halophilus]|uniref:Oxidoreductase n=1 Tax=Egicoccus halophilus TaxID=1670830 RepID=A0A8J3A6R7_9ACTN|nr:xanthine dehydrogenase family protein molybdopterin-binding subunit [Egicoccus halophilus]GGI02365.1 oxidoreductase [Egicoccus halophilus]
MNDDSVLTTLRSPDDARLTGALRYTVEESHDGALHAAFVLSPSARARVVDVALAPALAVPGVVDAFSGRDLEPRYFGRSLEDYPVLARDEVRFVGQRIAVVVAETPEAAAQGVDLVELQLVEEDPVLTVDEALAYGPARAVHRNVRAYSGSDPDHPDGNYQGGDMRADPRAQAVIDRAPAVAEATYRWERSHAAPLEPHACVVDATASRIDVRSTTKEPFRLRETLARLADVPVERVVVRPLPVGGDFGSKASPFLDAPCMIASLRNGRPVRATMSYVEELTTTSARHPGRMTIRVATDDDGMPSAVEVETLLDGGAFAAIKPQPTRVISIIGMPFAPYRLPALDERVAVTYSNTLPGGHVRAPGEMQSTFAGESHVDVLARRAGIDPLDYRVRLVSGVAYKDILERLRVVRDRWRREAAAGDERTRRRGLGLAIFQRAGGRGHTEAVASVDRDGVLIRLSVPEQGSGMYEVFRRIAADVLRLPADRIRVETAPTSDELPDRGAGASRVTVVAGQAVRDACVAVRDLLGGRPVEVTGDYWPGAVLGEGAAPVTARGTYGASGKAKPTYGGLLVDLAVDSESGHLELQRAHLVVDGGPVLDAVSYRGQLEGGFAFGLSQALYESLVSEGGQIVTGNLGDYKCAVAADMPPLTMELLPDSRQGGSSEVRGGVGELVNLGVAPAIANALADATGIRLRHLPMTANDVWDALRSGPAEENLDG